MSASFFSTQRICHSRQDVTSAHKSFLWVLPRILPAYYRLVLLRTHLKKCVDIREFATLPSFSLFRCFRCFVGLFYFFSFCIMKDHLQALFSSLLFSGKQEHWLCFHLSCPLPVLSTSLAWFFLKMLKSFGISGIYMVHAVVEQMFGPAYISSLLWDCLQLQKTGLNDRATPMLL